MTVVTSKLTVKSQTVIPRKVRERLGLKPGDTVRYLMTEDGVTILPADDLDGDPFVAFTEWASPEDDEAFKDL